MIETWTPRPAFHAADEQTRNDLLAGAQEAMRQLAEIGVVTLGWGRVEPAANSTSHEWFAVWQAPSKELADKLLEGVEDSGWYTYFEQSNAVGELRPAEAAIAEHLALGADAR
ncbi:DUF6616 family protein [Kitasatospora sp. NPDC057692]|uniref:DUF6616 family protein n=1 Tax=Kitasatospora sp. NPDC057692 TaxID=3346215 RepID=UPI00368BAE1E